MFSKKEELVDDDDITEGMMLADKDMQMMKNEAPMKPKKKRGRPPKKRLQVEQKILPKKQCSFKRPQLSYAELIAEALMQAENRMLQLSDILKYISKKYPYFKREVRHNMGWKKCVTNPLYRDFEKVHNPATQEIFWRFKNGVEGIVKKKIGRPKKISEMDLARAMARAMMAKNTLRVELEDIGTTIVPKLLAVHNGECDRVSSLTSPKKASKESPIRMELDDIENNTERARNRKRKQVKLQQNVKRGEEQEEMRMKRRRKQNKAAAQNYRERKTSSSDLIESEHENLCKRNEELKGREARLESQIKNVKALLPNQNGMV